MTSPLLVILLPAALCVYVAPFIPVDHIRAFLYGKNFIKNPLRKTRYICYKFLYPHRHHGHRRYVGGEIHPLELLYDELQNRLLADFVLRGILVPLV